MREWRGGGGREGFFGRDEYNERGGEEKADKVKKKRINKTLNTSDRFVGVHDGNTKKRRRGLQVHQ